MSKQDAAPVVSTKKQRMADLVSAYRAANPQSRVVSLFPFARNGSSTKSLRCICCGSESPTWCGRYRKTKRVEQWESDHMAAHVGGEEVSA